jgi:hypothetical protein
MDFIAYKTDTLGPTALEGAVSITDYDNATWVERYREPGEFKFSAKLSSMIRDILPVGTLVSHLNTVDLMVVESHEINETVDADPTIDITGRSFDAYLEQRVVGLNRDWASSPDGLPNYVMAFDYSYNQARDLINNVIVSGAADDVIPYVVSQTDITGSLVPAGPVARVINRGYLSDRVREILAVDDLGLRVVKRNPFGTVPGDPNNTLLIVHNGKDRRSSVIFSSRREGDIDSADYLWTNKTLKDSALVTGKWLETRVDVGTPVVGYPRRVMYIQADDVDQNYPSAPTGAAKAQVLADLRVRGLMILAAQRGFMMQRSDISIRTRYQYRRDYGIGDLITVQSTYGDVVYMRVTEFTEIQDANGETSHPTLAVLDY